MTTTPTASRIQAIDVARAVTIIGVVFNHTILGFISAGLIAKNTSIAEINAALYIFRMPALVLIAGLFIPGGVGKNGAGGYIGRRLTLLIYLYVLWYYIQTPIEIATSGVKNHPKAVWSLLTLWWPPAQLWFLPFLAVVTVFVAATVAIRSLVRRGIILTALVGAGVALWSFAPNIIGLRGLALVSFLAIGAAIGLRRMGAWLCQPALLHLAVLAIASTAFTALFVSFPLEPATLDHRVAFDLRALSAAAAACGVAALLSAAALVARTGAVAIWLAKLGERYTLEIYLAHIIAVAGLRILGTRMGIDNVPILAAACVTGGVLLPVLLAKSLERAGIRWVFEPPARFNAARRPAEPMIVPHDAEAGAPTQPV